MTNIRDYSGNVNPTLKNFQDHSRPMQPSSYITSILQNGIENKSGAYNCEKCFKSFKTKQKLTHHMDSHDETKKFICDFPNCDRRYRSSPLLKNHKKSHKVSMNRNNYPCDQNGSMNKQMKVSDVYPSQGYYPMSPNINPVIDCQPPAHPLSMHLDNVTNGHLMSSYPNPDNSSSYDKSYSNNMPNTVVDYPNVSNFPANYYHHNQFFKNKCFPSQQQHQQTPVSVCFNNNNQQIDSTRLPFNSVNSNCYSQLNQNPYDANNSQYPPSTVYNDPSSSTIQYNNAGYPDLVNMNENYSSNVYSQNDNFPQQKFSIQDWKGQQSHSSSIPDDYINNSTPLSMDNNNGKHSAFQFNNSNSVNSNSTNSSIMNNTSFVMSPLTPNHGVFESTVDRFETVAFNIGCIRSRVDSNPSITLDDIEEIISNDVSASSVSSGTQLTMKSLEDHSSPSKDFNSTLYYDNQNINCQITANDYISYNANTCNQLQETDVNAYTKSASKTLNYHEEVEPEHEEEEGGGPEEENDYYKNDHIENYYDETSNTTNPLKDDHDENVMIQNQSPPIIK